MRPRLRKIAWAIAALVALGLLAAGGLAFWVFSGRGGAEAGPAAAGFGPEPAIAAPAVGGLPTINVAPASSWPDGRTPTAAAGLQVAAFASGLDHPRWLLALPNGDVLVAESNKPKRPEGRRGGLKGWVERRVMEAAGAGVPSADRISLLRDGDGDGVAEIRTPFLTGLHSPFGMALVGETLYVANADALVAFPYRAGETRIAAQPRLVARLPAGRNHHWTKSLIASADGRRLYVGVGSNSNIANHGMEEEANRAAILEIHAATGATRVYASGLRNPVGMDWNPETGALWASVNERDGLGGDVPPDYMTSIRPGGFYGWPWSYWGGNVDARVQPQRPDMVARAIRPDYALGAHTSSLGFTFAAGADLGPAFASGAFVGQHGSWNRRPHSGYKVIFVPFSGGAPSGPPVDVLTGFLSDGEEALGRPVGVEIARDGALLVADDVGNVIWRVARR